MGASAGATGRFNVGEGAEKRGPAFEGKCGRKELQDYCHMKFRAFLRSVNGPTARRSSSAVACDAIYC